MFMLCLTASFLDITCLWWSRELKRAAWSASIFGFEAALHAKTRVVNQSASPSHTESASTEIGVLSYNGLVGR